MGDFPMKTKQIAQFKIIVRSYLVIALLTIVAACTCYQLAPITQRFLVFRKAFFDSFAHAPWFFEGFWFFMSLHAIAMLGVLLCFFNTRREKHPFWQWHLSVGMIGYTFMCLTYVSRLYFVPKMTLAYLQGGPTVRSIIETYGIAEFDFFNIAFGFPAIWFIVFGLCAAKNYRLLAVSSWLIGIGYVFSIYGYLTRVSIVLGVSSAAAIVFFIIWVCASFKFFEEEKI